MTKIYHITHINNLKSIISCEGLFCDKDTSEKGINKTDIAYDDIKERRAKTSVPVGPRGYLCDYVPFYFAPKSPMLYTINRGNVSLPAGSQGEIVHLVSSVENVISKNLNFAFTDGHAIVFQSEFYSDVSDLNQIDWAVMDMTYWSNTEEIRRKRQAEFLVHNFLPWSLIEEIGVMTKEMKSRTNLLVESSQHKLSVTVQRNWYYLRG